MRSSPRFRRGLPVLQAGTSVIAAIVVAAVIGAVALGIHAVESNSANVAALPAQAAAAPESNDGKCTDGADYTYQATVAAGTFVPTDGGGVIIPSSDQTPTTGTATKTQTCPTDAQALQYALAHPQAGQVTVNGQTQGLSKTLTIAPGSTLPSGGTTPTQRNAPSCTNNVLTQNSVPSNLCAYTLQSNNTYKLNTWTCRVALVGPSSSGLCYVNDIQEDAAVSAPTAPTAAVPAGTAAGTVVPANSDGSCPTGSTLQYPDGYDAECVTTSTATTPQSGTVPANSNGTCPTGSTATYPDGYDLVCQTSSTVTPASGLDYCEDGGNNPPSCTSCPGNTTMGQNGICNPPNTTPSPTACPAGQTGTPPNCTTSPAAPAAPAAPVAAPAAGKGLAGTPISSSNSALSPLTSFLTGLARGLTSQPCYATPQTNTSGYTLVPQAVMQPNGTYTTVYVQQPTTVAPTTQPCSSVPTSSQVAPYGVGTNGVACTVPPQQPQCPSGQNPMPIYGMGNGCVTNYQCTLSSGSSQYGIGTNGAACNAPPAQPQCPSGQTVQAMSSTGNGCVTSYQCVSLNGSTFSSTPPTPQISCSPQIADVGESVAITYACQNATGSSGGGFSTNNQLSGSASTTIQAPPQGSNTANFGLTCTNNGQTASAQCSVEINQPSIDLVADPQAVPQGATATIGWVTAGMQSCVVSSPSDPNFTSANASDQNINGSAQTDPITGPTTYNLSCQTLGGETQTASTNVTIGTSTSTTSGSGSGSDTNPGSTSGSGSEAENVTISSTADGASVNHGGTITITWQAPGAPQGSALSLWLINVQTEQATALIVGGEPTNGTYQFEIPPVGSTCNTNSVAPCASTFVAGDSYGIEAAVYTPANAYLGGSPAPANSINPTYSAYGYSPTPFSIGQ